MRKSSAHGQCLTSPKILRKQLAKPYPFKTHSDCEVIIPLYEQYGLDAPKYV